MVGYIGRINQKEKEQLEESDEEGNYRGTQYIGKLGVEQRYERELHGITGVQEVETSAGGTRCQNDWPAVPPPPVKTWSSRLTSSLQKMIEDLVRQSGVAHLVALDPRTGEVLAFVSKPTFDPNLFVDGIDSESWKDAE